jgi:hypothetical protein
MGWQNLIIDIYERTYKVLESVLEGLTTDDLNKQPDPDCNSIGWMTWHLTRGRDRAISDLLGEPQLWIKDGWHGKFNRPADPGDTGFGHSSEDVVAFKSPDSATFLAYHKAVLERSKSFISDLAEADLERKLDSPVFPSVGARLTGNISDNLQHAGQAAYVRGLLKGKGWAST